MEKIDVYRLLKTIVQRSDLHAKWLNTLSFMENAGAKKISACEHSTEVNIIQLKHAAEEHRHAYYLKKQIGKINPTLCRTYNNTELLAPIATKQYLHALDIKACKYLRNVFQLNIKQLKYVAYLFVTYAIEVRADKLYPVYQQVLTQTDSKVMVKSIILEEEGHLEEMINQLKEFSNSWKIHAEAVSKIEDELHLAWLEAVFLEITSPKYV